MYLIVHTHMYTQHTHHVHPNIQGTLFSQIVLICENIWLDNQFYKMVCRSINPVKDLSNDCRLKLVSATEAYFFEKEIKKTSEDLQRMIAADPTGVSTGQEQNQ